MIQYFPSIKPQLDTFWSLKPEDSQRKASKNERLKKKKKKKNPKEGLTVE